MDRFYLGFCNKTIWPLFHYFPMLTYYEEENWQEYRNINRLFGEAVVNALRPDDVLWIHDYHLMLLPKLLREKFPDATAWWMWTRSRWGWSSTVLRRPPLPGKPNCAWRNCARSASGKR